MRRTLIAAALAVASAAAAGCETCFVRPAGWCWDTCVPAVAAPVPRETPLEVPLPGALVAGARASRVPLAAPPEPSAAPAARHGE